MAADKVNLALEQGATFRGSRTWTTGTPAAPVNLTGFTARMMLKATANQDASQIIAITKANPCVVTTQGPHRLATGKSVVLSGVLGMTAINNVRAVVTQLSANTFSLAIDSTAFATYSGSGTVAFCSLTDVLSADGQIILGGALGTVQIYLKDSLTDVLSGGGAYDLELVSPTPTFDVTRLQEGSFAVDANVTR